MGIGYKQVCLPAEEGGNLQNIHIFGSHGGFFGCMNVGHGRYSEGGVHFLREGHW